MTIPQVADPITLNGRESKIIITDFKLKSTTILYSTADLLTAAVLDNKPIFTFWLPEGESGEIAIKSANSGTVKAQCAECKVEVIKDTGKEKKGYVIVKYTQGKGVSVVELSDGSRILLVDRATAYHFWAPTLSNDPYAPEDEIGRSLIPVFPHYNVADSV